MYVYIYIYSAYRYTCVGKSVCVRKTYLPACMYMYIRIMCVRVCPHIQHSEAATCGGGLLLLLTFCCLLCVTVLLIFVAVLRYAGALRKQQDPYTRCCMIDVRRFLVLRLLDNQNKDT